MLAARTLNYGGYLWQRKLLPSIRKLNWKRIYHAGEWCDEPLDLTGALNTYLEGYGIDIYAWERVEENNGTSLLAPIASQPQGGYVEADAGTTVEVRLPAGCKKVGIRYLTDKLSPVRAPNVERECLSISIEGGELERLDTMVIWSGISFAVYSVCSDTDCMVLKFANTGTDNMILHWQNMTSGKELDP